VFVCVCVFVCVLCVVLLRVSQPSSHIPPLFSIVNVVTYYVLYEIEIAIAITIAYGLVLGP
jgi:hypothetical protein